MAGSWQLPPLRQRKFKTGAGREQRAYLVESYVVSFGEEHFAAQGARVRDGSVRVWRVSGAAKQALGPTGWKPAWQGKARYEMIFGNIGRSDLSDGESRNPSRVLELRIPHCPQRLGVLDL